MTIKLIYSIISLILVIVSPIFFFVYEKKINKVSFKFWDILIGIVIEFICKHVLVNFTISLFSNLITNTTTYVIVYVLLTALSMVVGLLLIDKLYYHDDLNKDNALAMTLGMSIADILNTTLMAAISNLLYISQMNSGTLYENLIKSVSSDTANSVIETYTNLPNDYFIYVGIITLAMLASNYLVMVLFVSTNRKTLKIVLPFMIELLFTTVYYFTDPTKIVYANIILIVFTLIQFVFGRLNLKNYG